MYETIFSIANTLALLAWILLIILPHKAPTNWLLHRGLFFLLLAMAYGVFIVEGFQAGEGGNFGSIAGVRALFASDAALLAGWIHYLAFDLFVGSWIVRDAKKWGIKHGWIIVPLIMCFMLGPLGLLVYYLIRTLYQPKLINEKFS